MLEAKAAYLQLVVSSVTDDLLKYYECKCGSPPFTDGEQCPICVLLNTEEKLRQTRDRISQQKMALTPKLPSHDKPYVYMSSKVHHADKWQKARTDGVNIISSWIDAPEPTEIAFDRLWRCIEAEVCHCDVLVLFVERDDFPIRGCLIEVGMALVAGKPVVICAPGVTIEGVTSKPFGSWIEHDNVYFRDDLKELLVSLKTRIPTGIKPELWVAGWNNGPHPKALKQKRINRIN